MCDAILAVKPDLVITEKGVSDLAQHFLVKQNVTALRRVRKTDNNCIARHRCHDCQGSTTFKNLMSGLIAGF
jgi:chaperonin GroEL (HSP60 family)